GPKSEASSAAIPSPSRTAGGDGVFRPQPLLVHLAGDELRQLRHERHFFRLLVAAIRDRHLGDLSQIPFVAYRSTQGQGTGAEGIRSEEHTSELQSRENLVCRLLLEKKKDIEN